MRAVLRPFAAVLVALAVAFAAGSARAAEPEHITKARAIALGAADDLDASRFADALDKVTQAEALYHAPTHLLIMADALSGLGRLADALEVYERLAAEPLAQTAPAAFLKAREEGNRKQRALLARVPSLLVEVSGAPLAQARATLDGKELALADGTATRVDPGKHALHVEASGFVPVNREIELAERGGVVKVKVLLEVGNAHVDPAPLPVGSANDEGARRPLFVPAMVAFGASAAALAVGAVTGGMSMSRVGELEERCTKEGHCPPDMATTIDEAGLLGNISTAAFVVAGAAAATGVVLLVLPGKTKTTKTGLVEPLVGFSMAGVRGRF